jgi:hypothetical protein
MEVIILQAGRILHAPSPNDLTDQGDAASMYGASMSELMYPTCALNA